MKKRAFFQVFFAFLLTFLIPKIFFAQNDSSIYERMMQTRVNCRDMHLNSVEIITGLPADRPDSLDRITEIWKQNCGETETMLRAEAIYQIYRSRLTDSMFLNYMVNYAIQYQRESEYLFPASKKSGAIPVVSNNETNIIKTYNLWTQNAAGALLPQARENTPEQIMLLYFTHRFKEADAIIHSQAFRQTSIGKQLNQGQDRKIENDGFYQFGAGVILPLGKLKTYTKTGGYISLKMGGELNNNWLAGFGVDVHFFNSTGLFRYFGNGELNETGIDAGGFIYLEAGKRFVFDNGFRLETLLDLGYHTTSTNLRRYDLNSNDKEYYSIKTFGIKPAIQLRKRLKRTYIGLYAGYNFVPFKTHKQLRTDIGNSYLTTGLSFSF